MKKRCPIFYSSVFLKLKPNHKYLLDLYNPEYKQTLEDASMHQSFSLRKPRKAK